MGEATVGVVGGYGATGKAVAAELHRSTPWNIRLGGRDLLQGQRFAATFDSRVSATPVDVMNANSLDGFCTGCSTIVNCGGPVSLLQDRVAQAAVRNLCHYVDPAGLSFVKERMLPFNAQIASAGLSFVVSAGWMPGLTELLPLFGHSQAKAKMDAIESVTVCFGDSGNWSDNAMRDGVWFLRQRGLRSPQYFSKGQPVRAKSSQTFPRVDLGEPFGACRFTISPTPESDEISRRLDDCDVFTYVYLSGPRMLLAGSLIAALPLPQKLAVRLLRYGWRLPLPVGGFLVVKVKGLGQGRATVTTYQILYAEHRDYWFHGTILATVARLVTEKKAQPGVHYLPEAVDASALFRELGKAGIQLIQSAETLA